MARRCSRRGQASRSREFLFTDTEQAYQANDLALLADHLIEEPVDMDLDHGGPAPSCRHGQRPHGDADGLPK